MAISDGSASQPPVTSGSRDSGLKTREIDRFSGSIGPDHMNGSERVPSDVP